MISDLLDEAGATAAPPDDEFIELVCQDEELLRAEFDALIAASWLTPTPSPPPAPPRPTPPDRHVPPVGAEEPPRLEGSVPAPRWNRQRSPPRGDGQHITRKAGDVGASRNH